MKTSGNFDRPSLFPAFPLFSIYSSLSLLYSQITQISISFTIQSSMIPPDWNLISSSNASSSDIRSHLLSADFSAVNDLTRLREVIALFQKFDSHSSPPSFPCEFCPKKFATIEHLTQHRLRRHSAPSSAFITPAADMSELKTLISESRDFLASEIRTAVRTALDAQAAVPVGVSFAGDLEISAFSRTPSPDNSS